MNCAFGQVSGEFVKKASQLPGAWKVESTPPHLLKAQSLLPVLRVWGVVILELTFLTFKEI